MNDTNQMNIGFHANQLSLRGTEVALFDYADFNERLLGNHSLIITNKNSTLHDVEAIQKFSSRFQCYAYEDPSEIDQVVDAAKLDVVYFIKAGFNDSILAKKCKSVVHSVFGYYEPHGAVYAYVSEWLALNTGDGKSPWVPHMVHLPETTKNLRAELGIPDNAIVFGRHGGKDTFDLDFAKQAVFEVASHYTNRYFVFLHTTPFCPKLPNIIHLEATSNLVRKTEFINTCDAMLHVRHSGETFGLAVAEFSIRNKPVLTWSGSVERSHIDLLGSRGIYFSDYDSLCGLLSSFEATPGDFDMYSERFSPSAVMQKFKSVFL